MSSKDRAIAVVKWQVAFSMGYSWAVAYTSGNWWYLAVWPVVMIVGVIAEMVIEKSEVLFK